MTDVAADLVQDEDLDILALALKHIKSAAFMTDKLEVDLHQEPEDVFEALFVFLEDIEIEDGLPGLEVIIADNADQGTEGRAPVDVNLVEIYGEYMQIVEHDLLVHHFVAKVKQMAFKLQKAFGCFDTCQRKKLKVY